MIITEIQYFFSKIIRFQAIFKDTVEFTCALEFKISSQRKMCGEYSKDVIIYIFESITEWMQKKLLKICKTRLFRKGAHSFRADHPIVTLKKILKSTIFMDLRNAGGRTWTGTGLPPRDFKSLASAYSATPADALRYTLLHGLTR